jgi:hypothetical protein
VERCFRSLNDGRELIVLRFADRETSGYGCDARETARRSNRIRITRGDCRRNQISSRFGSGTPRTSCRDVPSDKMTGKYDRTSLCDAPHELRLSPIATVNRFDKTKKERRLPHPPHVDRHIRIRF